MLNCKQILQTTRQSSSILLCYSYTKREGEQMTTTTATNPRTALKNDICSTFQNQFQIKRETLPAVLDAIKKISNSADMWICAGKYFSTSEMKKSACGFARQYRDLESPKKVVKKVDEAKIALDTWFGTDLH